MPSDSVRAKYVLRYLMQISFVFVSTSYENLIIDTETSDLLASDGTSITDPIGYFEEFNNQIRIYVCL